MSMESAAVTAMLKTFEPDLIPLDYNMVAVAFPLMKMYPAEYCLRQAIADGRVRKNTMVVESSSGTMALALAIVCNWRRQPLTVVTDHACDEVLQRRLEDLGARVERITSPAARGGYQEARLDRLHQIQRENPDSWWLNQYDNPSNTQSYEAVGAQLVRSLGRVHCLVGTVGSGGSLSGVGRYLRSLFKDIRIIGVDTFNSVLFGQDDGQRSLRGLGNSILPRNLDHTLVDEVNWVTAAEAYTATRLLHQRSALFRGGTSGATWLVARRYAQMHPEEKVVLILPDDGVRYTSDIYNNSYMRERGLWVDPLPKEPRFVKLPHEAAPGWCAMQWNQQSWLEVMDASRNERARGADAK
jgi:cysteine synthase